MIGHAGVLLLAIGVAAVLFGLVNHGAVLWIGSRRRVTARLVPISVLKPLKGAQEELYENLASLARQDYPCFELVCGVEDPRDPAIEVVRRLARDFPHVAVRLVTGAPSVGLNPKVNNLRHLARRARHPHWLVSDADIRVGPAYLRALAAEIERPEVGLVSNVLSGVAERTLGACLDNLHLNTFVARSVCGAELLAKHPCVVGKSMFFRRSDLEKVGGWAAVEDVLAEDYVLGQRFRAAGLRVALCPYVVAVVNPSRSVREFVERHVRWGQMRRQLIPWLYWGEPLLLPAMWLTLGMALLAASSGRVEHARAAMGIAAAALAVQGVSDAALVKRLRGYGLRRRHLALVPLRDWIALGIWLVAAFKTSVSWRGTLLTIGPGSVLSVPRRRDVEATALQA